MQQFKLHFHWLFTQVFSALKFTSEVFSLLPEITQLFQKFNYYLDVRQV